MMDALKNKTILGVIGLFIVIMLGYNLFFKSEPTIVEGESAAIGSDLLAISEEISKATLGQALFSNPGYILLTDFSVPLPQEPMGRSNPFDILGRD